MSGMYLMQILLAVALFVIIIALTTCGVMWFLHSQLGWDPFHKNDSWRGIR